MHTCPLIRSPLIDFRTRRHMPVAAGGLTLSFIASTTSTAATITAPSSINAGDLLVLMDTASSVFVSPTTVVPTGFTSISNRTFSSGSAFQRAIFSYKIANGSEDSSSITGMDGNLNDQKIMMQFRGSSAIAAVTPSTVNFTSSDTNPTAQNAAASGGVAPLIVLGGYYTTGGTIDPRTMSPAKDGEANSSVSQYLAYKIYNSSPADVSVDMDDEGSGNAVHAFYLQAA